MDAVGDNIDESPPTTVAIDPSADGPPEPISTPNKPPDNMTFPGDSYTPKQTICSNQTVNTIEVSAISAGNGSISGSALDEETPPTEPGIAVSTGAIPNSSPPEVYRSMKRPVLDESGSSLESVLEALKTQSTKHIENSLLPGEYALLTNADPMAATRIITSIGMNCVNSVFLSLASALEIEKRRLHQLDVKRHSNLLPACNNRIGRSSLRFQLR